MRNMRTRRPLGPEDGDEAFDRHIPLAVRIHRAAGLNARASDKEGQAWRRYVVDYFPPGHNTAADADFLWSEWRTRLLKHESPRGITHGQAGAHWHPLPEGGFCVNLESIWDDFEHSVVRFMEALEADEPRRMEVLRRWRGRSWTIRDLALVPSDRLFPDPTLYSGAITVSTAMSTTTIDYPLPNGATSPPLDVPPPE
jgi:hypothetical protein